MAVGIMIYVVVISNDWAKETGVWRMGGGTENDIFVFVDWLVPSLICS